MCPDGAWLGYRFGDSAVVTVVTPEQSLTRRIVDSVRRIEGVDGNGCPVTLGEAEVLSGSTSDSLSICRYDEADRLTASRRLVGADAQAAEETILLSPAQRTDYDCPVPGPLTRTAILQGGGYLATVVTDASCEGRNGVFLSGSVNVVDDDVRELVDLTRLP